MSLQRVQHRRLVDFDIMYELSVLHLAARPLEACVCIYLDVAWSDACASLDGRSSFFIASRGRVLDRWQGGADTAERLEARAFRAGFERRIERWKTSLHLFLKSCDLRTWYGDDVSTCSRCASIRSKVSRRSLIHPLHGSTTVRGKVPFRLQ
mmetsp:Transcript_1729/g.4588  ORF Transcript_1729/g.4588 Transcript_1729/m.4588 type:complete len:152 (-) Transcript_1729:936-1391(-)